MTDTSELINVPDNSAPVSIVHAMLDKGGELNPDQMSKWMDLQERWEAKQAKQAFLRSMALAQAETPSIYKDSRNDHTNSNYAKLEKVQAALKPVYTKHGFAVSFTESDCPRDGWLRIVAIVDHIDGHREEYHRDAPVDDKGAKGGQAKTALHGTASTNTYIQRHLLCGIFGVVLTNQDTDGNLPGGGVVTDDQGNNIMALLDQLDAETVAAFYKWAGCESPLMVPAAKYQDAMRTLRKKVADANR